MNRQTVSTFKPLAAALLAALGIAPLTTQAATIIVTFPGDSGIGTTCTLRQAIVTMNNGSTAGSNEGVCRASASGTFGSSDTIKFSTGIFPSGNTYTITLASGQLSITDTNLTIDATANGNITIDANHASHVMYDSSNTFPLGSLTLNHLTLLNGVASSPSFHFGNHGGGICIPYANLTLSNSTLSGNAAAVRGGGIFSLFGSLMVTNSTISGNVVGGGNGGGISNASGNITLTNSTVSGNSALDPSAGPVQGGGGIYSNAGHVTLTNSTLSANKATVNGGGIFSASSAHVTLTNSTVSGNSAGATSLGGGISVSSGSTLVVNNSIVAGNKNGNSNSDINGSFTGTNNLIGGDPMLGALGNNGGPTQTMLPAGSSPALNAGLGTVCKTAPVSGLDQRGLSRPQGPHCDIGAVEDTIFADGFE